MSFNFQIFFETEKDKVYSLCYRYLQQQQEAEDAVQEIFVKVYFKKDKFREEAQITTWLYRITVNHCLDLLKSKKRKHYFSQLSHFFSAETDKIPDQNNSKSLEEKQGLAKLHNQLNRLPEKQLTVIVLNKLEGIPLTKVAEIMNTSYKAAESLLQRGKQNLQKMMDETKE